MSFHHLDQYAHIESPITHTPPVVRLLGTMVVAVGAAALPLGAWGHMAVLALLVGLIALMARVPARVMLLRVSGPLAFVVLASTAVLFLVPGQPVFHAGPVVVTDAGLLRFGSAIGRAVVALGAAVILVSTTGFPDLVSAFRDLRLPRVVTTSLGLAYRLLYTLVDEIERIERAARSRNVGAGARRRRQLAVGIAATALTRSFARGERTYRAMLARGYHGEMPSLRTRRVDANSLIGLGLLTVTVLATTISAYMIR